MHLTKTTSRSRLHMVRNINKLFYFGFMYFYKRFEIIFCYKRPIVYSPIVFYSTQFGWQKNSHIRIKATQPMHVFQSRMISTADNLLIYLNPPLQTICAIDPSPDDCHCRQSIRFIQIRLTATADNLNDLSPPPPVR